LFGGARSLFIDLRDRPERVRLNASSALYRWHAERRTDPYSTAILDFDELPHLI
jgi:hypothetical protein